MHSLLFWTTLPFLLPQALYVRHTAPRFSGAGGPNHGSVGAGEPLKLLAVGDSIIAGVGASELSKALVGRAAEKLSDTLERQVNWRAYGFSGANSTRLLERHLPQIDDLRADVIITSIGINDVTSITTLPHWRENLSTLFRTLLDRNEAAVVAFAGLPPLHGFPLLPQPLRSVLGLRARDFDLAAREIIARYPQVIHVPVEFETTPDKFAPDGYHPNEASYVTFGEGMAEKIVERLSNR